MPMKKDNKRRYRLERYHNLSDEEKKKIFAETVRRYRARTFAGFRMFMNSLEQDKKVKQRQAKRSKYRKDIYQKNKELTAENHRLYRKIARDKVMNYYSGGKNRCACCGEIETRFLTIDHIYGKKKYNHDRKMSGHKLWSWLIKNNFPSGFQVLCMQCNWAKGKYGICPHQEIRTPRINNLHEELKFLKLDKNSD